MADLFAALVHFPVLNRAGKTVTSAITSLDLHDLARAGRTYGLRAAFIAHPVAEQRRFAQAVVDHWRFDYGRTYDSRRREALEILRIVADLDEAVREAQALAGSAPLLVPTSARTTEGISAGELRSRLEAPGARPMMMLFGTAFGLAPAVFERADLVLAAVRGPGDYNHLSVRSAMSIILDRLRGR